MAKISAEEGLSSDVLLHLVVLSLLAPAWYCIGRLAQQAKLPLITGYVIGGIVCGPSGLNLVRKEAQRTYVSIDHACLAIIAVTAGAELHFDSVRRIHKQVIGITLGIALNTWLCVFIMMRVLLPYIPFLGAVNSSQVDSIVSLAAMLMVARSPASAIAVVKETGGKGPYCSLILAVVVMKDVLVFVCFAVNLEFTRMMQVSNSEGGMRVIRIVQPFISLGASILWGMLAGTGMSAFVHWKPAWKSVLPFARRLPTSVTLQLKTSIVALSAISIFWLADRMNAEPLLACVMAGIITTNRRSPEPSKDIAEHTGRLMTLVNTAFFGLAGASLRMGDLLATIWVAVLVWAARIAGIYSGSWLGAKVGETPSEIRRRVWQGMVTQAGVAMGLAKTVATRFPSWGPEFATLMVAIILLNLVVGPPLFRSAIYAMGEARDKSLLDLDKDNTSSPRRSDAPRSPSPKSGEDYKGPSAAEKGLSRSMTGSTRVGASTL